MCCPPGFIFPGALPPPYVRPSQPVWREVSQKEIVLSPLEREWNVLPPPLGVIAVFLSLFHEKPVLPPPVINPDNRSYNGLNFPLVLEDCIQLLFLRAHRCSPRSHGSSFGVSVEYLIRPLSPQARPRVPVFLAPARPSAGTRLIVVRGVMLPFLLVSSVDSEIFPFSLHKYVSCVMACPVVVLFSLPILYLSSPDHSVPPFFPSFLCLALFGAPPLASSKETKK